LHEKGRAEYIKSSDNEALEGFEVCATLEGIIPALEAAHAIMPAVRIARDLTQDDAVILNLSGRGDKDVQLVADLKNR
jgi:tryptophan synthase beta chain